MSALRPRDALLSRLAGAPWPAGPLLGALKLPPGAAVLEVGAGEGHLLRELRRRGHRGLLEGLDLRPGPGVRRGDAHLLPWAAATFDAVLFVRVLAHLERPAVALREGERVLRPGGALVVAAHGPDHLRATWAALGQGPGTTPRPVPPPDGTTELRVPVRLTRADLEALARSYGQAPPGPEVSGDLADTLHLRVVRRTAPAGPRPPGAA
ncbi:class I SAM-dependent methyltransferase [Deinococcus petrolearius]|uniref:Class I SAM-dependent methyltransferase n=1 Tax=Deinococcus petrolearius TaxID=1751295 RepID=A0ABW1DG00_9DEIO